VVEWSIASFKEREAWRRCTARPVTSTWVGIATYRHSIRTGARLSGNNSAPAWPTRAWEWYPETACYLTRETNWRTITCNRGVEHAKPHCNSPRIYNGPVLDGRSKRRFPWPHPGRPKAPKNGRETTKQKPPALRRPPRDTRKPAIGNLYAGTMSTAPTARPSAIETTTNPFLLRARGIGIETARRMLITPSPGKS